MAILPYHNAKHYIKFENSVLIPLCRVEEGEKVE